MPSPPKPSLRKEIQHKIPNGGTRLQRRRMENEEGLKLLYLRALTRVWTQSAALKAAGAHRGQLYKWRETDDEFVLAERAAKEEIVDLLEAEAIRRALKGVKQPVYQGGLLAGYIQDYSDGLLSLLLKGLKPERYREKADISVNPIVKVLAGFDPADAL